MASIVGVLPLAQMKTRLFGNTLVSTPFCVYGGPLAGDQETAAALATHAEALRARSGATAVELRQRDRVDNDLPAGAGLVGNWVTRADLYVTFRKPIVANDEANLKAIPRKQRAMVRKGLQNGLVSRVDQEPSTPCTGSIYAESVRNLGTPVFARRYFGYILLAAFRDCADDVVTGVLDNGIPSVAGNEFLLPRRGAAVLRGRHACGAPGGGQRLHVLGSAAPCPPRVAPSCSISGAARSAPAPVAFQAQLGLYAGTPCPTATAWPRAPASRTTIRSNPSLPAVHRRLEAAAAADRQSARPAHRARAGLSRAQCATCCFCPTASPTHRTRARRSAPGTSSSIWHGASACIWATCWMIPMTWRGSWKLRPLAVALVWHGARSIGATEAAPRRYCGCGPVSH